MKKIAAILILIAMFALKAHTAPVDEKDPFESIVKWTPNWNQGDHYVVSEYHKCGGNGGNDMGTYDPKTFDAEKARQAMITSDKNWGCPVRRYSKSRTDAIAMVKDLTNPKSQTPWAEETVACLKDEHISDAFEVQHHFEEILEDQTNLGVFTSFYDYEASEKNNPSEGCSYHDIYIFRANGNVLKFTFNYTD